LSIFGFPGNHHSINNLGLLDERLAVEWVRDNIDAFGGDPARITLAGDSAGAGLVDLYSFAFVHDPIITGIALLSGTAALRGWDPVSWTKAERKWDLITCNACQMGAETDPAVALDCVRKNTTAEIIASIPIDINALGTKAFFPLVDGKVVFSEYYELTRVGNFTKVPRLIGSAANETAYHQIMSSAFPPPWYPADFKEEDFNYYTCPASELAEKTAGLGVPTWRYAYFGDFKGSRLTTAAHGQAYQGSDVLLMFGNELVPGVKQDADEFKLAKYTRGALAAFVKNPKTGLTSYGWPLYNPKTNSLIQLGKDNKVGTFAVSPAAFDKKCSYTY
jgi:carboxylesterase type B